MKNIRLSANAAIATVTAIIGALTTAAHTGAVDTATTVMGYVKQLVTDLRSVLSYMGTMATAAATGAVGTTTTLFGYIKQLVTELQVVDGIVDSILEDTAAIPVLTETGGTLSADGTEQDVYKNDAPSGVFKPIAVKIDCTNHTVTESITIKTYYRIKSGGNYILQDTVSYLLTTISPELLNIALEPNRYGVKVTLEKTAGTNRDYDWEVVYEV